MRVIERYGRPGDHRELAEALRAFVLVDLGVDVEAFYSSDDSERCTKIALDDIGDVFVTDGGASVHVLTEEEAELVEALREDGGAGDLDHLRAWRRAGRPSLEEIEDLKGIGRLNRTEVAAVRALRAGEILENFSFSPERIAAMRGNIFLDALAFGEDAVLGEPPPEPAPKPKRRRKGGRP